jgi:protein required for attachment to host cells
MEKMWIIVANTHRARCFERDAKSQTLNALADFVLPPAGSTAGLGSPPGDPAKERGQFAREIADFLNKGAAAQRFEGLELIVSGRMLGELRPCLSTTTDRTLRGCVASDLTHYQGAELRQRIDYALRLPN